MARAARTSSAASAPAAPAAPAPAAAAPAPAAKGRQPIPDLTAPASPEQPVVTKWDSYDNSDDGGMPAEPGMPQPKADANDTVTVDVDGKPVRKAAAAVEAEVQSLRDQLRPEEPAEPVADVEVTPPKPKAADRRRQALDALSGEQRLRGMEGELSRERTARQQHEKLLRTGSLGELLAARGIDPDVALEQLSTGTFGKAPEPAPDDPPAVKELRDEIQALKRANQASAHNAAMAVTERAILAVESAPVVHAAIQSNTIVDYDRETGRPLMATELISRVASQKWRAAGAHEGEQARYVTEATEALDEILAEQHDPIAKAIAKKRGTPAVAAAPRTEIPAAPANGIGRRVPATPGVKPKALPMDREERDAAIKRQYNM